MLGMNDDPIFAARAIEAGAKGYVSKSGELLRPLRDDPSGRKRGFTCQTQLTRSIAFAGTQFSAKPQWKLTSREMEILRLLRTGRHTASQKHGVPTSTELVCLAIDSGVA